MNVWGDTVFLYSGDVLICGLLFYGLGWIVRPLLRRFVRRAWVVDLQWPVVRRFLLWQLAVVMVALVGFKFLVLASFPHDATRQILSGDHGSVQVSTVAEAVSAALVLVGLARLFFRVVRGIRGDGEGGRSVSPSPTSEAELRRLVSPFEDAVTGRGFDL